MTLHRALHKSFGLYEEEWLFSAVNMAGLAGEVLGTITPDSAVYIINTGAKLLWLFCLGRSPICCFQMFYFYL